MLSISHNMWRYFTCWITLWKSHQVQSFSDLLLMPVDKQFHRRVLNCHAQTVHYHSLMSILVKYDLITALEIAILTVFKTLCTWLTSTKPEFSLIPLKWTEDYSSSHAYLLHCSSLHLGGQGKDHRIIMALEMKKLGGSDSSGSCCRWPNWIMLRGDPIGSCESGDLLGRCWCSRCLHQWPHSLRNVHTVCLSVCLACCYSKTTINWLSVWVSCCLTVCWHRIPLSLSFSLSI